MDRNKNQIAMNREINIKLTVNNAKEVLKELMRYNSICDVYLYKQQLPTSPLIELIAKELTEEEFDLITLETGSMLLTMLDEQDKIKGN